MMRGLVEFFDLDIPFDVPSEEAIAAFRAKGLKPTFSWLDMRQGEHATAFTVAKMLDVDLLKDVQDSLDMALADGVPFREWADSLIPTLQAKGWWGRKAVTDPISGQTVVSQLGSAHRLRTIFRTNMQSAYAAGQWEQIEEQAEDAPFLLYDAVDDFRTRPLHASWDGKVLPVTSKWWKTHTPPCGFNCRCGVVQLDSDDLERMGLKVNKDPRFKSEQWTNPRTGEKLKIPEGVDPGFGGAASDRVTRLQQLLGEKIKALPPEAEKAAKSAVKKLPKIAPPAGIVFDETKEAGKWNAAALSDAPDWIKKAAKAAEDVGVINEGGKGAWAKGGELVNMGTKHERSVGGSRNTWRHELGHIIDARIGVGKWKGYISSEHEFGLAMEKDAGAMVEAAGLGRKSAAQERRALDRAAAYEKVRSDLVDMEKASRLSYLQGLAKKADIDLDAFTRVLGRSTMLMDGPDGSLLSAKDLDLASQVRLGRMLEAIGRGDGEHFVRLATMLGEASMDAMQQLRYMRAAWERDGSFASLSDLIGASSRNKVCNHHDGFWGHSTKYYKHGSHYAPTEVFANLYALAGNPDPYWWQITKKLAPNMTAEFEKIIQEAYK